MVRNRRLPSLRRVDFDDQPNAPLMITEVQDARTQSEETRRDKAGQS
jgi:hypothetical protein